MTANMKNKSTPTCTFKQFNDEMNDFYNHLKDKFTDDEIRKILTPLNTETKKKTIVVYTTLISVLLLATLYFLTYIETISWHFSALGRIFLIKLLPFWDWTVLKNEKCLITRSTSSTVSETTFNCDLCENINQVDVYSDISEDALKSRYLDVEIPVIVKKKPDNWPTSTSFLQDLLSNSEIATSRPCKLATNIHDGLTTVKNLLSKTNSFDSFFLHFQNCDLGVVKQFRRFTPRPSFLPPELSPVQYSWLLWNRNYNISHFKPIDLVEKIGLVGQIVGSNYIKLLPRNNCELECPLISVKLNAGEFVIFSSLWNLEYRPSDGENLAAILEMH